MSELFIFIAGVLFGAGWTYVLKQPTIDLPKTPRYKLTKTTTYAPNGKDSDDNPKL